MECSYPVATNAITGNIIADIFPITYLVAKAIHTETQTSQLHRIVLVNASIKERLTFLLQS